MEFPAETYAVKDGCLFCFAKVDLFLGTIVLRKKVTVHDLRMLRKFLAGIAGRSRLLPRQPVAIRFQLLGKVSAGASTPAGP
jgi:hypothetical protein